jgi:hypothetical protein
MVVAEEIRSSRPCIGAAVAGTGCGRRGMTGGSGSSVREGQCARGLSEGVECWASGSARAREKERGEGARERERERWAERGSCGREEREGEELGRAGRGFGLPSPLSSSFLFLFYTQSIQTKLFEFK